MLYALKNARRAAAVVGFAGFVHHNHFQRNVAKKITKCDPSDTEFNFEKEIQQLRKLKNDNWMHRDLVAANMFSIQQLLKHNPKSLHEMLQKCKDNQYNISEDAKDDLHNFALLQQDDTPDLNACNVLLSSVQYHGQNISLDSPYARQSFKPD